jgi:hypothetical protein
MKTEKFIENLLEYSISKDFFSAQKEWKVHHLEYTENGQCICGQKHITRLVIMYNVHNYKLINVGYNCYRSTLNGQNYDTEFKKLMYAYKLSRLGIFEIPTLEQIIYNYNNYIINEWEFKFLVSIKKYAEYSNKQLEVLKRVLKKFYYDKSLKRDLGSYGFTQEPNEDKKLYVCFKGDSNYYFLHNLLSRPILKQQW